MDSGVRQNVEPTSIALKSAPTLDENPTVLKLIRRTAWTLLALLALLAGFAVYSVRGSLAQIEGDQQLVGLSAAASIERDVGGVATISATNASDAARRRPTRGMAMRSRPIGCRQ